MTSLREQLLTKRRPRVVVPVRVSPTTDEETEELASLMVAAVTQEKGLTGEALERAEQIRAAHEVDVEFEAIDSVTWEKVAALHPAPTGEDSGMDWRKALPVTAALCCTDESMQDPEAWSEVTATWTYGELLQLWGSLLRLNTATPQAHLPKG